ncbi:uncharacterized protein B0T23DRAFT_376306 [Neurospora hispaniola]|uniref:Uncharacterized protein n=1 Tax=Neurospora hispaniola TaxID=588809 RepID=A0AAJ0MS39_9PEZI|nr:hypothetical protein B0T23DRAFT_376306 [Neurospora hispaniola]
MAVMHHASGHLHLHCHPDCVAPGNCSASALSLPMSRRESRSQVALDMLLLECFVLLPSTPSIECHCWLTRMAGRLPALASAWAKKGWRPYFRGEGTQSYLTEATQHMASSGRVAWPDCKGLTAASEGQRTMVGYVAGVRANLETGPMEGQGGREVVVSRSLVITVCSVHGAAPVQLGAVWCSE